MHLLAVLVVDDLVAIVVIATVYSREISWMRVALPALVFLAFFVPNSPRSASLLGTGACDTCGVTSR